MTNVVLWIVFIVTIVQVISRIPFPVIASGAKQSHKELAYTNGPRDCFVGKNALLAMTEMHF